MSNNKNGNSFWTKLRHKYRLSIYRDQTYEQVLNLRLSRLNVVTLIGAIVLVFLIIVISIIAYTPVREFIPGYPNANTRRNIIENAQKLDSLTHEIEIRDLYFYNINSIISGKEPNNFESLVDTSISYSSIDLSNASSDSLIDELLYKDDEYNLHLVNKKPNIQDLSKTLFFSPVRGTVTNSFNAVKNHYGTDIVAGPNEVVKATLEGTITMSTWTLETGHVIQIQHDNNLISCYKHNAEILKHVGDHVRAGEPIAIVGNSGELTTGPHLHFELWHDGRPLNPEDYITFQY